ncbi:MAG: TRAP transporter substrate-binding protein DctP [Betaproteobacteria bacterium]
MLGFILLFGALAWPAWAQPYKPEYRLSTAIGPAYAWGRGASIWAQLIKERTAGRITVRQFPGSSATAGDPSREFAALRDGTVDMAIGSTINWADQVPVLNVFALPFFVADPQVLDLLLRGEVGAAAFAAIQAAGVVPLAWGDNDFRSLSTAGRPVRKPEDLAGLRLRTGGAAIVDDALRVLGAAPAKMNFATTQAALLAGTLDGQEITLPAFVATKSHTLGQLQVTAWKIAADPLVFAVSRAAWESWTAADRDIVRRAAVDAAQQEIELARAAASAAEGAVSKDLKGAGVKFVRPDADERAAFVLAIRPVTEKWTAVIGPDLVKTARTAMAPAGKP